MSTYTLRTPDGKIVKIDPGEDVRLYDAPHNPPNTGTSYTRGTDLYAHKARSGKWYFYKYHWSMWQGEGSSYELISDDEAIDFLIDKAGDSSYWGSLGEGEKEKAIEIFGRDIFEETA
ncbi:MAG: hypothetical protein JW780_06060 [Clostridiales bacterium]|nr:hypothetical protein [Clostridiales bacterium]